MLGINWLQLVSPVIDWSSGKVYLPNAVHTILLQGDWLEGHVKADTVTILARAEQLRKMNETEVQDKIAILKCPKFWRVADQTEQGQNSWTNSFKGRAYWGYLYNDDYELSKHKRGM